MRVFLETGDVADRLGISKTGVIEMVRRGVLKPAAVTQRGLRLFSDEAVERAAKKRVKRERAKRKQWNDPEPVNPEQEQTS